MSRLEGSCLCVISVALGIFFPCLSFKDRSQNEVGNRHSSWRELDLMGVYKLGPYRFLTPLDLGFPESLQMKSQRTLDVTGNSINLSLWGLAVQLGTK